MPKKYILNEKGGPVLEPDILKWAEWFENLDNRCVKNDLIGGTHISTVFLGLDHSFGGSEPVLWETMIFNNKKLVGWQDRYSSKEEALIGHQKAVDLVGETL